MISAYRLMWLMVMFDLPVKTHKQQKNANDFRENLLHDGFERCQFSVYAKFCGTRERMDSIINRVTSYIPDEGKVNMICFTDKQFSMIKHFEHAEKKMGKRYEQLLIFDVE